MSLLKVAKHEQKQPTQQSKKQIPSTMKTKFTEMMEWFNAIIDKQESGSDRYMELVAEKYQYIGNC